jgi:hypothetical protein
MSKQAQKWQEEPKTRSKATKRTLTQDQKEQNECRARPKINREC